MKEDIRILLFEDNSFDAELIKQDIQAYGSHLQVMWVKTRKAFINALYSYRPELILSDFMFPDCDGFAAMEYVQTYDPRVPFIIVTGSLSEEVAADCIKKGAWDYVLKERLVRLIPAIENAMVLKRERLALDEQQRQNKINQLLYQSVVTLSQSGIVVLDEMGVITMANDAFAAMLNCDREQCAGKRFVTLPLFAQASERLKKHLHDVLKGQSSSPVMLQLGAEPMQMVEIASSVMRHENSFIGVQVFVRDVTERMAMIEELKENHEQLKLLNKILRHDITNYLASLKSGIRLYRRNEDEVYLDKMDVAVAKSLDLIHNIRGAEHMLFTDHPLLNVNLDTVLEALADEHPEVTIYGRCEGTVIANTALPSLFENLIQNALLHGSATQVDVRVQHEDDLCRIEVADNGTGIPDNVKPRIFDEGFHYGKTGQSGLGLYISRTLVQRYGGTVSVTDNQPAGTTFIIELARNR